LFLKQYRTGEEIAKVVVREWRRLQSISVVDFLDIDKEEEKAIDSPSKHLTATD
jgi:hypothetical protein